eukprot:GHUV01007981.1.p1 GENE.GHUV01007981.1~~GHUV01007981.1.p1  ORF type:complete len:298 (+),score=73.54 GHUV01007981.1:1660-2553(+)
MEGFAVLTMAIYLGMVHLLMLLAVASIFSRTAMYIMIGTWCTLLLPAQLGWPEFLGNPVWRAWRRYFRFSVIMDEDMELHNTTYVIPEYPHGVFPLSQLIAVSLTDIWPNHFIYSIAADAVFHIPLWKHVMTWIGALPATAHNFRKLLQKGSVGLIPGGIAEMFMVEDDREVIKLLDRKGFVRIAVEMGTPLVPCYHFGNSRLFRWGPKSWEQAARRHRVALGFLCGRWGLPFALPNRVPLMMVVGGPIPTKQTPRDDPNFDAVVDEAHAKLVEAMQQLYDKYKGEYGWADRPLVIK